jgi:integrase
MADLDALKERTQRSKARGNGHGSIVPLPGGGYKAVLTSYENGRRRTRTKTAPTSEQADRALTRLKAERDAGVLGGGRATVGECVYEWLRVAAPKRRTRRGPISAKTLADHRCLIDKHIVPRIGKVRLDKLTVQQIEAMYQDMADAGLSQSTISHTRDALSMSLDRAVKLGLMPRNLAKSADLPKVAARAPRKSMTPDQAAEFIQFMNDSHLQDKLPGYRYAAAYIVQMTCGLRPGEVLGLTWDCVDLDAGTLAIRQALLKGPDGPIIGHTKTPRSVRTLDLPAVTVLALLAHRDRQDLERAEAGPAWMELGLVFPTSIGLPSDRNNYRHSLRRATTAAGLEGHWVPYELRHTFVSLASDGGVPTPALADAAGNSERMIEEVYRHQVAATIGGHVSAIEAILGG